MHALTNENDQFKQSIQQSDRTIAQLKRENEELQQKVNISNGVKPNYVVLIFIVFNCLSLSVEGRLKSFSVSFPC